MSLIKKNRSISIYCFSVSCCELCVFFFNIFNMIFIVLFLLNNLKAFCKYPAWKKTSLEESLAGVMHIIRSETLAETLGETFWREYPTLKNQWVKYLGIASYILLSHYSFPDSLWEEAEADGVQQATLVDELNDELDSLHTVTVNPSKRLIGRESPFCSEKREQ